MAVYYDVQYAHAVPEVQAKLSAAGYSAEEVVVSHVDRFYVPPKRGKAEEPCAGERDLLRQSPAAHTKADHDHIMIYGRRVPAPQPGGAKDQKQRDTVLFIGEEGPTLTNFLITYNQSKVFVTCGIIFI
jgi:diphthamide biosynthesis enzyme Dph1/Dph2-like protein